MGDPSSRNERLHEKKLRADPDDRTPAERDRDRVLYSSAFRRLGEVTQVVSPLSGHVFHNRLTHSLRVAQFGQRLAEKLLRRFPAAESDLDPNVVECACLAHDLGHPPFGHCAEEELNELAMAGGFEGNAQSFRILTKLAFRSENYKGLDLTRASLAAVLKYPWLKDANPSYPKKWGAYESEQTDFDFALELAGDKNERTIEAELMDWADDVTYAVHDLEDFYRAGRVPLHTLAQGRDPRNRTSFFEDVFERRKNDPKFVKHAEDLKQAFTDVMIAHFPLEEAYTGTRSHRAALRHFTGNLIGRYIDAIALENSGGHWKVLVNPNLQLEVNMLKELVWTYVIEAPSLATQQHGQRKIIAELFRIYVDAATDKKSGRRTIFPDYYRERLEECGGDDKKISRTCVDLIAGLAENQAIALYSRLTGVHLGSGLEDLLV